MESASVIGLFVGVGLAVTSGLHTWYVTETAERLSFGLPFSSRLRVGAPVRYGYLGAGLVGAVSLFAVVGYLRLSPPPSRLTIEAVLQSRLPELTLGAGLLATLSQVGGGSSWSKVVLDGALFFMAGILLVSYVQPPSFWNLFTVYATIVPTLGGAWGVWRDYYVATRIADDDDDAAVLYPHFPSFAYFAGSAAYTLVISMFLLVGNVE